MILKNVWICEQDFMKRIFFFIQPRVHAGHLQGKTEIVVGNSNGTCHSV